MTPALLSSLPKTLQDQLRELMEQGHYKNELEAIEAAVQAQIVRNEEQWIKNKIDSSLASGPSVPMDDALGKRLTAEGLRRAKNRKK